SPHTSISSPPAPSTPKNSSRRHWRLPRNTGRALMASGAKFAMTSGEIASASRGTDGCSLSVRVIMSLADHSFSREPRTSACVRSTLGARPDLGVFDALQLHGIILERHRVMLLEKRFQVILDLFIERGLGDEFPTFMGTLDVAFLDR